MYETWPDLIKAIDWELVYNLYTNHNKNPTHTVIKRKTPVGLGDYNLFLTHDKHFYPMRIETDAGHKIRFRNMAYAHDELIIPFIECTCYEQPYNLKMDWVVVTPSYFCEKHQQVFYFGIENGFVQSMIGDYDPMRIDLLHDPIDKINFYTTFRQ